MHHTGEDVLLWCSSSARRRRPAGRDDAGPAPRRRGPRRGDHPLPEAWRTGPTGRAARSFARCVERFTAVLVEHLDLEEREILPLVSRHVTADEWNRLGDHGKDAMTGSQLPIMFGLVLEDADEEERAGMLSHLPRAGAAPAEDRGRVAVQARYISRVRAA